MTPMFVQARNANDLATKLGVPEPYTYRSGTWLVDHEKLATVIELALHAVHVTKPVDPAQGVLTFD